MKLSFQCIIVVCAVLIGTAVPAFTVYIALRSSPALVAFVGIFVNVRAAHRARDRVLCRIEHEALRDAGRELLRRAANEDPRKRVYYRIGDAHNHPEVLHFPQTILELAPQYLYVEDGYLTIVMYAAGPDNLGVIVYPEGFQEPSATFNAGDRKLIEGLWYYDNAYRHDPEYDKAVERWIRRGKNRDNLGPTGQAGPALKIQVKAVAGA